jgi:hypothetical protein
MMARPPQDCQPPPTGGSPDRPTAWDSSLSPEPLSLPDPTGPGPGSRMPAVKNVGEPCAGEPLARIDAAAGGNQRQSGSHSRAAWAPPADPTQEAVGARRSFAGPGRGSDTGRQVARKSGCVRLQCPDGCHPRRGPSPPTLAEIGGRQEAVDFRRFSRRCTVAWSRSNEYASEC